MHPKARGIGNKLASNNPGILEFPERRFAIVSRVLRRLDALLRVVVRTTQPGEDGERVFETWWTTRRGVEIMDNSYPLMDLEVYGRQEAHEDSTEGWPKHPDGEMNLRRSGRPISQWSRVAAGRSDDLASDR